MALSGSRPIFSLTNCSACWVSVCVWTVVCIGVDIDMRPPISIDRSYPTTHLHRCRRPPVPAAAAVAVPLPGVNVEPADQRGENRGGAALPREAVDDGHVLLVGLWVDGYVERRWSAWSLSMYVRRGDNTTTDQTHIDRATRKKTHLQPVLNSQRDLHHQPQRRGGVAGESVLQHLFVCFGYGQGGWMMCWFVGGPGPGIR